MIKCNICQTYKSIDAFHKDSSKKSGRRPYCKGCVKLSYQKYYNENKQKVLAKNKKWRDDNPQKSKAISLKSRNSEKGKKYNREYQRNRLKTDPLYKLANLFRSRIYTAFRRKDLLKSEKTKSLLGADLKTVKLHIENQFKQGMSWENHGEWHIDHIKPLGLAKTKDELINLCNYQNLQPLWAEENLKKGKKHD